MENFGFDIYVTDPYTGKKGRVTGFDIRTENPKEKEWKEKERLYKTNG